MKNGTINQIRGNGNAPQVNREYKSTLFTLLFSDPKELLGLYNAMNGTDYEDIEMLSIVTLGNAVYMNFKNDISFVIDMRMQLYEHQSTYNPNMPLRNLIYVAKEYEKLYYSKSIYTTRLTQIAAPKFYVFYNGVNKRPEVEIMKLSDAYTTHEMDPDLELKIKVLNINKGFNPGLMEKCKTLKEYMLFVDYVRRYAEKTVIEEAVDLAITECIRSNILKDFLEQHRAEATDVSIFEYNEAEELEKIRKAEYSYGYEDGVESGRQEFARLINILVKAGRYEDIREATENVDKRQELYKELNITTA